MDKDLSRRDFLKLSGALLGGLFMPPKLGGFAEEAEPAFTDSELIFKTDNIEAGSLSHPTANGYEISVKPKAHEGETVDINHKPTRPLKDLLSDGALSLLHQTEISGEETFGVQESDYSLPLIQTFLRDPNYKNRLSMKEETEKNGQSNLVLPQLIDGLNSKKVQVDQLILLPSKKAGKDSLVIWTYEGKLKLDRIKTPGKDSKFFTSGGIKTVGDGIIQIQTEEPSSLQTNLYSFGPEMTEIPNSENNIPWNTVPDKNKEYLINYDSENQTAETTVETVPGGIVCQLIKKGGKNAISVWNVQKGEFQKPVEIEEIPGNNTTLFAIGGNYFGIITKDENPPGLSEGTGDVNPNMVRLRIYSQLGKVEEIRMDSYAAALLAERRYSPRVERNSIELQKMLPPFSRKFDSDELQDFVSSTISSALIADGEALGTHKNEILVLFCEDYDSYKRESKIWAAANPDLTEIPPEERNQEPQPAPFTEVRA